MKNKGLIVFITILFLAFSDVENGAAQSKILVKAGPTFAFGGDNNYWGGGVGIEKQLGRKWSFSTTFEYLQASAAIPTLTTQSELQNYYYDFHGRFMTKSWAVYPEFRLYPKNNPLVSLEGFFIGLGLEIGQVKSQYFDIFHNYPPNNSFENRGILSYTNFGMMPHLSLGSSIPLGEKLSLELSGGLKVGFIGSSDLVGFLPIVGKVRYAF